MCREVGWDCAISVLSVGVKMGDGLPMCMYWLPIRDRDVFI